MELYVHIPFCVRKCLYCDFLSFPAREEEKKAYIKALKREIRFKGQQYKEKERITSIFFGGGTPSLLTGEEMESLLFCLRESFHIEKDAEISMEANPGTLNREKLAAYKRAGINRLSLGCQSVHDEELKRLGRIHSFSEFKENYELAREIGFDNINVDLMAALPGQTLSSFKDCLHRIVSLSPEHISAYSLIIEEGTPFYEREDQLDLPDEDTERDMYAACRKILKEAGYLQYEISNYAKEGFACRHNTGYWDGTPYLGLGLGASSYVEYCRFKNVQGLSEYIENAGRDHFPKEEWEELTLNNRMEEYMFLGLRMLDGVSIAAFEQRFGLSMQAVYGEKIEQFVREKLLTIRKNRVCLTEKGLDLANRVMAGFLL